MGVFGAINKMKEEMRKDREASRQAKEVYKQTLREERVKQAKNAAVREVRQEYKKGVTPSFGSKLLKGVKSHLKEVRERNAREERAAVKMKRAPYHGPNTPPMFR